MSNSNIGKALNASTKEKKDAAPPATGAPKDATVLNIIYMGTNSHHCNLDAQCVLTALYNVLRASGQLVHIVDGPGAEPAQTKEATTNLEEAKKHPMQGTYSFECSYNPDAKENEEPLTTKKTKLKIGRVGKKLKKTGQQISGKGYKKVVEEILLVCDALIRAGKVNLILNMYGYSRGADITLRVANILLAEFRLNYVCVNICAVDPVPGPWRKEHMKARIAPPNVGIYYSILMRHEPTPFFEPMDASWIIPLDPEKTQIRHQIYYGCHGAAITMHDPQLADSAKLLWDDIHKFAERTGTKLKTPIPYVPETKDRYAPLNNAQRLNLYSKMKLNEEKYAAMRTRGTNRAFLERPEDYLLHGKKYFSGKEHQELLKAEYKDYFDYFFQRNIEGAQVKDVKANMQAMAKDPELIASLQAADYPTDFTADPFPLPRGIPIAVQFSALASVPHTTNNFWRRFYGLLLITNLAHHDAVADVHAWGKKFRAALLHAVEHPEVKASPNAKLTSSDVEQHLEKFFDQQIAMAMKTLPNISVAAEYRLRLNALLTKPELLACGFVKHAYDVLTKIEFEPKHPPEFAAIQKVFLQQLQKLGEQQLDDRNDLFKAMLLQGLNIAARVRYVCGMRKEVRMDKVLRNLQTVLPTQHQPMTENDRAVLEKFAEQLNSICPVTRLPEPRERSKHGNEAEIQHETLKPGDRELQTVQTRPRAVSQFHPAPTAAQTQVTPAADQKNQNLKITKA